jgi:putative transposase
LRYIHGNPKAANMQQGWFYDYSNYGSYDRLTDDGVTQWHPAFLALGTTLEMCAAVYRKFCKQYKPKPKPEKKNHWGSQLLATMRVKGKPTKTSPGQKSFWNDWDKPLEKIRQVSEKFVLANCFDPQFTGARFNKFEEENTKKKDGWCQVEKCQNPNST